MTSNADLKHEEMVGEKGFQFHIGFGGGSQTPLLGYQFHWFTQDCGCPTKHVEVNLLRAAVQLLKMEIVVSLAWGIE